MNNFKYLWILLINSMIFAQEIRQTNPNAAPSSILWAMSNELDEALLKKDTARLQKLLHNDLTLGHSNGWTETKKTLIETLPTSKIHYYEFIPLGPPQIIHSGPDLKTIRRKLTAVGEYDNEPFEVNLKILEIWIYENHNWQLLARQSVDGNE